MKHSVKESRCSAGEHQPQKGIKLDVSEFSIPDVCVCFPGAPWDMVSRNYSAVLVNEALGLNLTQLDMVSVSSEEDIGLVQVLNGWNTLIGSAGKQVGQCGQHASF